MIELRWLKTEKVRYDGAAQRYLEEVAILQYRESIHYAYGPPWGEWKDVPTVEEKKDLKK